MKVSSEKLYKSSNFLWWDNVVQEKDPFLIPSPPLPLWPTTSASDSPNPQQAEHSISFL